MQALPAAAEVYAADQRVVITRTVARTLGIWRRMREDFDRSYAAIEVDLLGAVTKAQRTLVEGAQEYVPAVLTDLGASSAARPVATADPRPLVGLAGDGRPLESLLYGAVTHAKQLVVADGPALAWPEALRQSGQWLSMATMTVLSDTGRQSESLAMGVRPKVAAYARMLNPPSCSRCVILAGRVYRSSAPFLRHPRCDCRHIPAAESVVNDLTVNPAEYFDSMSPAEQDRVFTSAGAEAIRNGADIGQVVNARRGMRAAQIGGRRVEITTEGTTRRGIARRYLDPSGSRRGRGVVRPRLMPETIRTVATSPADYLRLLRANGYLRG